jgi:serine-type D-Ala-D-Ala carboxypeptidase/endopeptidase (penicillin-binding protein 4)
MIYEKSSVGFRSRSRRSRARRRRAFATIALVVGLVSIALLAKLHFASRPLSPEIVLHSPAQRSFAPVASWSNDDRNRLKVDLRNAFAPVLAGATSWSLAVISADGRTIYDNRAQDAVAPASTQKLIVAASALDALGPSYRYHTLFAARDSVGDDGALGGNLWLIGSGDPSLQSADLRNGVAMLGRSGLRRLEGGVVIDATALSGPELNSHWAPDDDGQDYAAPTSAISVDGDTIASHEAIDGIEQTLFTPMQGVAKYVAGLVQGMLVTRGIAPEAPASVGPAPLESVVLWDHRSAPLQALESHMLYVSDNHYAEQLLRTVGEEVTGQPDDAGGIEGEREYLARRGIPTPGLRLFDGSGLSGDNRVAGITLARVLADSKPSLYRLLPLGGREGTLEDYDFTTALGRVRAKSGHISGVSALAGYVTTLHHGRVAFAFLIDGSPADPDDAIVRAVDRLAER